MAILQGFIFVLSTLVHATGKMPICGPFMDNQRALFILDCASLFDAEQIVKKDPFIIQGYYRSYTISEFIYAHEGNNWLIDYPIPNSKVKSTAPMVLHG